MGKLLSERQPNRMNRSFDFYEEHETKLERIQYQLWMSCIPYTQQRLRAGSQNVHQAHETWDAAEEESDS